MIAFHKEHKEWSPAFIQGMRNWAREGQDEMDADIIRILESAAKYGLR